jgi:hypothetical protein
MDNNGIKKYEKSIMNIRPIKIKLKPKPSAEYTIAKPTAKKIPQNVLNKIIDRRGRFDAKSC